MTQLFTPEHIREQAPPRGIPKDARGKVHAEAGAILRCHKRAGLDISMGVGKTSIGITHMEEYRTTGNPNPLFLVVGPTAVLQSWRQELAKLRMLHLLPFIHFCTYTGLLKQPQVFDIVFLDECHMLTWGHDGWLCQHTGRIVGLTGTPPVSRNSEKSIMVSRYCPMRYNYSTEDAVSAGILNNYRIFVHELPLSETNNYLVKVGSSGKGWYTSERTNYEYWQQRFATEEEAAFEQVREPDLEQLRISRMSALKAYPTKMQYSKYMLSKISGKCLVFANTIDQAKYICEHSIHSRRTRKANERTLEQFSNGDFDHASAVGQISAGVNIRKLYQLIIMHSYSNERNLPQRLGRALRLEPHELATIHVLMYKDTVDEDWVSQALRRFNQDQIKTFTPKHFTSE